MVNYISVPPCPAAQPQSQPYLHGEAVHARVREVGPTALLPLQRVQVHHHLHQPLATRLHIGSR